MFSYTKKFKRIETVKLISYNPIFFWENNKTNEIISGVGCIEKIELFNAFELDVIKDEIVNKITHITNLTPDVPIYPKFLGGHAFNIKRNSKDDWENFPRGYFILPEYIITSNNKSTYITLINKSQRHLQQYINSINDFHEQLINQEPIKEHPTEIIHIDNESNKLNYFDIFNRALEQINSGFIKKIVLSKTKKIKINEQFNFSYFMQQLRKSHPKCINFYIKFSNEQLFFGSTPERLINKDQKKIKSEAIAGTIKRGATVNDDIKLEKKLSADLKNLGEHQLVVEKIKNILKPKLECINISNKPKVLKLKNVQHLITNITGELKNNIHILDLVKIMHPTPAVSGYPVKKAIDLIEKYELHDRGWYAGPIGWIDSNGDGDFCVSLRSAIIKNTHIQLFSGGGIVSDSNVNDEWNETEIKMDSILTILKQMNR